MGSDFALAMAAMARTPVLPEATVAGALSAQRRCSMSQVGRYRTRTASRRTSVADPVLVHLTRWNDAARGRLSGRPFCLWVYALTFYQLTAWSRGLLSHTATRARLGAGRLRPARVEGFARGETPTIVRIDPLVPCRNLQLRPAPASQGARIRGPA